MDGWASRRLDSAALPLHGLNRPEVNNRFIRTGAILFILLIGAMLCVAMLGPDVRFNVDEALYASYARRIALHGDFLLADSPLDKPPLGLFLTAASFSIFGTTEFAARLPTLFVSILNLAVFMALARSLYDEYTALFAALLLALSPLELAFAASNFLDPFMLLWLLVAALAAVRGHWGWCGLACALGIATKQNALFYLPLIIVLGICASSATCLPYPARWRTLRNGLLRFAGLLAVGLVLLGLWSAARAAPVDFWTLGTYNNDPGRFIRANEVLPRLNNWILLLGNVTGFSPILLLACVPLFARSRSRESLLDRVLAITLLIFLLGYWLVAFNVYDRYLLPLGPLVVLLVARGSMRLRGVVPLLIVALMIPSTSNMLLGRTDVGSNHDPYQGITGLVSALNALPAGSKVYDYSLDWELGFYLGDSPHVQMIWQPTPGALARAVCGSAAERAVQAAYFATPAADAGAWLWALKKAGGGVRTLSDGPFRLYRLDCTF